MLLGRVVLLTVQTANSPYVNDFDRVYLHRLDEGFMRVIVRYGFMEDPDVPAALEQCARFGETFAMMSKNATSATDFFNIPTNRVTELGTQLVL